MKLGKRLAGGIFAAIFAALPLCGIASPSDADGAFEALAQRFFDWSFVVDPGNATDTGVHTYDDKLADFSAQAFAREIADEREYLDELVLIEKLPLSPRTAVDAKALELQMRDDLLQIQTIQWWRKQPVAYADYASFAIATLIRRDFAPPAVRMRSAIARENALPALFETAKTNLTSVDSAGAEIAGGEALGLASFLANNVPQAFAGVHDRALQASLARSTHRAKSATLAFAKWLAPFVAHPTGSYAVGAANFEAMLRYEDAVDMPISQYLAIGERELRRLHGEMVATSHRIDAHKTVRQVIAELSHDHPSGENLLAAARGDLVQLRAFILKRHIVAWLPDSSQLNVTYTPAYRRETILAAMSPPGPLERHGLQWYFYVSPPNPHDSVRVQNAYLGNFNNYLRPLIAAHEIYPGHFTNFALDRRLPLTLTEKLEGSSVFAEGWAHYCEQMMVDEGWGNGDPRVRLMQLKMAAQRAARYVAGVKLHTQGMTLAQAARLFEEEAFMDPAGARIEAKRGTQQPLYGFYTLGRLEILKLRDDYRKKMGSAYTLAKFHAALLQYGDLPQPLIRGLILGSSDDHVILQ